MISSVFILRCAVSAVIGFLAGFAFGVEWYTFVVTFSAIASVNVIAIEEYARGRRELSDELLAKIYGES